MVNITFISFLMVAVALTSLSSASPYQGQRVETDGGKPADNSKHQLRFEDVFRTTTGPPEELPECPRWCLTQEECMDCQCGWGRDQRSDTCSCQAGPVGAPSAWCRPKPL